MRTSRVIAALAVLAGAAGVVAYSATARSADHADSPATQQMPTADINDVYAWMDTTNVVLAMSLYPNAGATAAFDPSVQYVFHTGSAGAFSTTKLPTNLVDVIATFDTTQKIKLWVGTSEYVTGDASMATGLASADGKVKVFAGKRADPFFFNIAGFHNTVGTVESAVEAGALTFDDAGCPLLDPGTAGALAAELSHGIDGGAPANDFATFNSLAIVVSLDKSLLTGGGGILSVWGATYVAPTTQGDGGTPTDAGGQ